MEKKHKIVKIDNFLHILSDDEIKKGDPFLTPASTEVEWSDGYTIIKDYYRKIIATTDKLTKVDEVSGDNVWTSPIPQVPQSLVEYYAKHKPEQVEQDYEEITNMEKVDWRSELKLQHNEVVWVEPAVCVNSCARGTMAECEQNGCSWNKPRKTHTREEGEKLC